MSTVDQGHIVKSVLFIEDTPETILGLMTETRLRGIETDLAESVAEGIEKLRHKTYDAIVLDWRLPLEADESVDREGGKKFLELLGSESVLVANRDVPVIVVTAQFDANSIVLSSGHRGKCSAVIDKMDIDAISCAITGDR